MLAKDDDWLRVNLNCAAVKGGESKGGESGARVCWHSAAIVNDENKWRLVNSQPNEHLLMRSSHCGHTQTPWPSARHQPSLIVLLHLVFGQNNGLRFNYLKRCLPVLNKRYISWINSGCPGVCGNDHQWSVLENDRESKLLLAQSSKHFSFSLLKERLSF